MLEHGGHLIDAINKYNIPKQQWLDLSTGINPNGWPIPDIPAECWQRLPETADGLVKAAQQYYQCSSILPVAGSQAAIQTLPLLRAKCKVGVLTPAYAEHAYSWKQAGHHVIELNNEDIASQLHQIDVLILINPNNPTGKRFTKQQLLDWHSQLKQRKGWLIVDEAFIDSMPEESLSDFPVCEGLIILRSIGKFFGLAGIRCGFVLTEVSLLMALNEKLGPWAISHPSRYIATRALLDKNWQQQTGLALKSQSIRLVSLLAKYDLRAENATDLFVWVKTSIAPQLYEQLAQQGLLTRLFSVPNSLRFGLPKNEQQWRYLEYCLNKATRNK